MINEPITCLRDIFDPTTGNKIASKGSSGNVVGFTLPPGAPGRIPQERQILFDVVFNVNNVNFGFKLQVDSDFIFRNGSAGLLNVVAVGASIISVAASAPDGTNLQVQSASPAQFPVGYRFKLSNGLGVLLISDRNIGILRLELDAL